MPNFGRRIAEIFIFEIAFSIVSTISLLAIGSTDARFAVFMIACLAANMIYMFFCLRYYYYMISSYEFYFKVNLVAYLLLAVVNIAMAFFNFEPFYTYLFFPYKLFMQAGLTKVISALIVHGIFIVEILIANVYFKITE